MSQVIRNYANRFLKQTEDNYKDVTLSLGTWRTPDADRTVNACITIAHSGVGSADTSAIEVEVRDLNSVAVVVAHSYFSRSSLVGGSADTRDTVSVIVPKGFSYRVNRTLGTFATIHNIEELTL